MKNKNVLMIHEMQESYFDLPLENYILTFDDGLYSQYYYWPELQKIPTEKIFFVSSNIVCEGPQSKEFPPCEVAHEKAFSGNKEDYMTIEQIKELMSDPLVTIGGHSHFHTNLETLSGLAGKVAHIYKDTELMLKWFEKQLGFRPRDFCFPYNDNLGGIYDGLLIKYGFINFYGKERIDINRRT